MEAYIGTVIMFAGNFAPQGWLLCDGRVLNIVQYQALFAVIGATYGGNGTTNFALPDLRGRVPLAPGQGPATNYVIGQKAGAETVTLSQAQMPAHAHPFAPPCTKSRAGASNPDKAVPAPATTNIYATTADSQMMGGNTGAVGNGTPISVVQPLLAINFLICVEGLFPPRP
jgi:microcystin-dependent protein